MKYLLGLLLLFLFACATEEKYQVKKPFLYEVTKAEKKAYLFGTIHSGVLADDLPQSFWPFFNESDIFISESNRDSDTIFLQNIALRAIRKPNEPKPSETFTSEEVRQISGLLKLPAPSIQYPKPVDYFSLVGIYGSLLNEAFQNQGTYIATRGEYVRLKGQFMLDDQLAKKAAFEQHKMMDTLDDRTSEKIVDCILELSQNLPVRIRGLLKNLTVVNKFPRILRLAESYRAGNEAEVIADVSQVPVCLLKDRNEYWMTKIKSIIKNYNRPFFAVGALHLIAPKDSVIELLKSEGYSVRRMTETFVPSN